MSNSTYIEMEDDVREDIGECLPSAPKKEKRRVEDVQPEPQAEAQEEKATPDNFKYNIGDIIKVADPDVNLCSPANPDKQYHDNLRVIFRFFDGNHVYIVEAEDGICLITPEQQTELVERSTQLNTPPDNKPDTVNSRLLYMIAADVLRGLGWEVEINEKDSYWNLVLTNTTSSEDMPESHKSCLRGLLRGWLMEFNFEGGRQQVNIYKELHGLDPEDDRYSCLDTCVKRTDSNTPQSELNDREIFVRRKDRFDRFVLTEPIAENITTRLSTEQDAATLATINEQSKTIDGLLGEVAQAKHDMERMKKENDANYQQAVGCLDAVKAMLELSQGNGATHRMRDFYGESIIKFIDSARQKLAARHDADPMPF